MATDRPASSADLQATFRIGVFGIVLDEARRVLLCHRTDLDLWNLPGGMLEYGEAPWEGVLREVKEETGLDVAAARLAGVYAKPDRDEIVFAFLCRVLAGRLTVSDEADRIEFFDVDALPENMPAKQVERIRDVIAQVPDVVMKIQRGRSSTEQFEERKM